MPGALLAPPSLSSTMVCCGSLSYILSASSSSVSSQELKLDYHPHKTGASRGATVVRPFEMSEESSKTATSQPSSPTSGRYRIPEVGRQSCQSGRSWSLPEPKRRSRSSLRSDTSPRTPEKSVSWGATVVWPFEPKPNRLRMLSRRFSIGSRNSNQVHAHQWIMPVVPKENRPNQL